jgi:hypothetical protein
VKEGFYVKNPSLIKKAWNNLPGRLVDWVGGYQGGQCGEFGEWGAQWSKPFVEQMFGKGAVIDTIYVEEKSTANPTGVIDQIDGVIEANHRATRVTLPNGQRLILDYWESMGRGGGNAKVVTEQEWANNWHQEMGSDFVVQTAHPENSPMMASFKNTMESKTMQARSEAETLKILEKQYGAQAQTYLNAWKRSPW